MMWRVGAILIGYAWGNLVFAYVVSHYYLHVDPSKVGSGNPGTANVGAVFGKKYGILTCLGDFGKTILALILSYWLYRSQLALAYTGLGLILGHCFPLWRHFRGGKGVAVAIVLLLSYDWHWALVALLIALLAATIIQNLTIPPLMFMLLFSVTDQQMHFEARLIFGLMTLVMFIRFWPDVVDFCLGRGKRVDILKTIKRKLSGSQIIRKN